MSRKRAWLAAAIVAGLTLAAFWPVLSNGFVNWDDNEYVLENLFIRDCSSANFKAIWTHSYAASYQPLTFMTYLLEYQVWGAQPAGYHAVSLGIHVLNSLLVMRLLMALGLGRWPSCLAAVWFGVHPMHVESVAWIAERKDVLCACFYLLALLLYARQARIAPQRFAWAAFGAYLLALLSKPMAVTLPMVMVLCDWYIGRSRGRRYWIEKSIFAVPALVMAGLIWAIHTTSDSHGNNLWGNIQMACRAAAFCLWKFVAPVSLSVFYPRTAWNHLVPFWIVLSTTALVLGGGILHAWRRGFKTPLLGLGWYLAIFLPVSGIVTIGFVFTADRFMYLASIGPLLAAAVAVELLVARRPRLRPLVLTALALFTSSLIGLTWQRCVVWRDAESLWRDAAGKAPDHYTLRYLGMAQMEKGKLVESEANLRRSIACSETQYGRYFMAEVLRRQGRHAEAIHWYGKFLADQGWYVPALSGYGLSLMESGEFGLAEQAFRQCALREPGCATHLGRLGWSLMDQGRGEEAETIFKEALARDTQDMTVSYNYAVLLAKRGDFPKAELLYRRILGREPRHLYALVNLGATLRSLGKIDEARIMLRRALGVNPRDKTAKELLLSLSGKK